MVIRPALEIDVVQYEMAIGKTEPKPFTTNYLNLKRNSKRILWKIHWENFIYRVYRK